jgi:hypothetical protein
MDRPARLSRRAAITLLGAAALGAVPGAKLPAPVAASIAWCKADPQLLVGDRETHINLSSYEVMVDLATGPIQLIVEVPTGMEGKTEVLDTDAGFGSGYTLQIVANPELKDSSAGLDILVQALAPASDGSLPVHLEVVPVTSGKASKVAKGSANEWIRAKAKL